MHNCSYIFSNYIGTNVFNVFSVVLIASFFVVSLKIHKTFLSRFFVLLVIGGSVLNIYERIRFECVHDPFNFFNMFHFNFADLMITGGVVFLMLKTIMKSEVA